jgi:hypothetical protein
MTDAVAAMPEVVFFGYWSGVVPPVTDLHFRSFLHHHPGARYELWLDADHDSTLAPSLAWLESHPRIAIRPFSLDSLIEQHVADRPVHHYDRFAPLRKLGRMLHRRAAPRWARQNAWEHSIFGLTYMHSSVLFNGFSRNKAYRGDLARCLVALTHYPCPALYVDLDVCFLTDLRAMCDDRAWAYRWEEYAFANSAILYLPGTRSAEALVAKGNELENFLPWILFTDDVCEQLGIHVHPTRLFDPLWDPTSMLYGDARRFFCAREHPALDLHALALERHLAIHWHNHWTTVPAPTSLYAGLLERCREAS